MYLAAVAGGLGQDDAVAGAASTMLVHLYPDEAAGIEALAARLGDVDSPGFARGVAIGRLLIARAKSDGSDAVWTGSVPTGRGYWVPTPPGFINPPLEPLAGGRGTCAMGRSFAPIGRPPLAVAASATRWGRCTRSRER